MSRVHSIKSRKSESGSPYHNWIETHGIPEEQPTLPMPVSVNDELLGDVLEALDAGIERKLSNQERRAFQLVVREGVSLEKAAKIVSRDVGHHVSKAALQIYVKRAAKKIRDFVLRKRV